MMILRSLEVVCPFSKNRCQFSNGLPGTDVEIDWPHCDSVLGNHPMPAGTYSYYFEVEFINDYDRHGWLVFKIESSHGLTLIWWSCSIFAIGFCGAWGRPEPFWEYYSDNGRKYTTSSNDVYGPPCTAGDLVGCGIDFSANTAYFTKNGEHLGR